MQKLLFILTVCCIVQTYTMPRKAIKHVQQPYSTAKIGQIILKSRIKEHTHSAEDQVSIDPQKTYRTTYGRPTTVTEVTLGGFSDYPMPYAMKTAISALQDSVRDTMRNKEQLNQPQQSNS